MFCFTTFINKLLGFEKSSKLLFMGHLKKITGFPALMDGCTIDLVFYSKI